MYRSLEKDRYSDAKNSIKINKKSLFSFLFFIILFFSIYNFYISSAFQKKTEDNAVYILTEAEKEVLLNKIQNFFYINKSQTVSSSTIPERLLSKEEGTNFIKWEMAGGKDYNEYTRTVSFNYDSGEILEIKKYKDDSTSTSTRYNVLEIVDRVK